MSLCPKNCGRARRGPYAVGECRLCWLSLNDRRYSPYVGKSVATNKLSEWRPDRCKHLGERSGPTPGCFTGMGCRHDCALGLPAVPARECQSCASYDPHPRENPVYPVPWVGELTNVREDEPVETPKMRWQYGVTTCEKRIDDGMCRATLESLARAGFDRPFLFADGVRRLPEWTDQYEVVSRSSPARTAANWVLALYELWARDSTADRFAVFQDDFVTYVNLREYLDSCAYPEKGYWNLYTFPSNQGIAPKNEHGGTLDGWFRANQLGKGAVALVFDSDAVRSLLGQDYLVDRFLTVDADPRMPGTRRCDRSIDGGIVEALKRRGWTEWCHSPSLVQHAGIESSMGNRVHRLAESFRGEEFDARSLVENRV